MKRITLSVILPFVAVCLACGQGVGFTNHTAVDYFDGPGGIYVSDLNNDGAMDIIAAGIDANTIAWWENDGQYPPGWTGHIIDDAFGGAIYASAADLNGDGYIDVLGAAWEDGQLAWWQNPGPGGGAWQKHLIVSGFTDAHEVMACDIDLDGDMDVLGVSAGLNRISLFISDGNNPPVMEEQVVTSALNGARSVDAADFDGDGDIDICGAGLVNHRVEWYSNNAVSLDEWERNIITSDFTYSHKVQAVDMDMDGVMDILGTAYSAGVKWWKNIPGESVGWEENYVNSLNTAVISWAFDYDQDGDNDIFCSAQGIGRIAFYENTDGNFTWQYHIIDSMLEAWPLHFGDLDNDSDIDLVCGGREANQLRWYENELTYVAVPEEQNMASFSIECNPVPFREKLRIKCWSDVKGPLEIEIHNASGQVVGRMEGLIEANDSLTYHWEPNGKSGDNNFPGIYYVRATLNGRSVVEKVLLAGQ